MRIISGNFKGKKILEPRDNTTRPLKDLTKESIFNIILHSNKFNIKLENSNILDLFSGVGSFGLECLSRGSYFLTFVENYKQVLTVLKKNILNLNYQDKSLIIEKNIFTNFNFNSLENKFDIIFMDPPYKEEKISILLNKINDANVLKSEGIIIIHRHKREKDEFPKEFNILEVKTYGMSKIIFGNYI
jgi:16S rRNA (guanine966-N2)-methyltransferase